MEAPVKKPDERPLEEGNPQRTAPRIERLAEGEVKIHVFDQEEIKRLYGSKTEDAADALFNSALSALGRNADEYLELMPAMAVEMEPCDALESMLVTQMTSTHLAITTMSQKFHYAQSPERRET